MASEQFTELHGNITCNDCKLISVGGGCPGCRGRRIQQLQQASVVEEDIPDVDAEVRLSECQLVALWEILRRPAAVIKRTPCCFRHQCVDEMTSLLHAVESDATNATLRQALHTRFFLFSRTVLALMPRGGQRGRAQARNILTKRLRLFRTSSLASIIASLAAARPVRNTHQNPEVAEDSDQQLELVRRRIAADAR